MAGLLVAFEGLDQSGKQTQAELVRDDLTARGLECRLLSFPDYHTPIGREIARALQGQHEYAPDVMQLLYVANRYEKRRLMEHWLREGVVLVCDRYVASSVAYGEAQGLEAQWLGEIQRFLPPPDVTILLDIAPETAVARKATGRDRYERDLALLSRVRDSYTRQAALPGWVRVDGQRSKEAVSLDVKTAVARELGPR
jgi:dTMP kinase